MSNRIKTWLTIPRTWSASWCLPDGTVTAEIARRQSDGTWLWVIDQFSISSGSQAPHVRREKT